MPLESLQIIVDPIPRDGPGQMALDEVLLGEIDQPILRGYRWSESWTTFGYSQSEAAVRQHRPAARLVRRWTGGGVVDHGADWTFALLVPRASRFMELRPARSYCVIHEAIAAALAETGVASTLAYAGAVETPGACFAGQPAEHDVLDCAGEKICGGAQRRSRDGLLHQGSLQKADVPEDFLHRVAGKLTSLVTTGQISCEVEEKAAHLARIKYAHPDWTLRRA